MSYRNNADFPKTTFAVGINSSIGNVLLDSFLYDSSRRRGRINSSIGNVLRFYTSSRSKMQDCINSSIGNVLLNRTSQSTTIVIANVSIPQQVMSYCHKEQFETLIGIRVSIPQQVMSYNGISVVFYSLSQKKPFVNPDFSVDKFLFNLKKSENTQNNLSGIKRQIIDRKYSEIRLKPHRNTATFIAARCHSPRFSIKYTIDENWLVMDKIIRKFRQKHPICATRVFLL